MVQPSAKLQSSLAAALLKLCRDPGLSADEAQWVRQFAMRSPGRIVYWCAALQQTGVVKVGCCLICVEG